MQLRAKQARRVQMRFDCLNRPLLKSRLCNNRATRFSRRLLYTSRVTFSSPFALRRHSFAVRLPTVFTRTVI